MGYFSQLVIWWMKQAICQGTLLHLIVAFIIAATHNNGQSQRASTMHFVSTSFSGNQPSSLGFKGQANRAV
jgi:hypothetical protein